MNENSILTDKLFTKHGKEVERIFREAVREALWRHKRLGQSVAASRDGKVVIVPPEEIPIDKDLDTRRLNKRERDEKEIEIINQNVDQLTEEATDALEYQVNLWDEVKDEI